MEPAGSDIGAIEETVAFLDYFKELPDPRQAGKVIYPLAEVLLLCLLAVLAGAESFVDIARFGEKKIEFLRWFRPFHHGTPAHDHLGDIFAVLDAERFQRCFVDWVAALTGAPKEVAASTARRCAAPARRRARRRRSTCVSAFAARQRLVLGQVKVADKANEIVAIPKLLDFLAIEGAIVTLDAIGCQRAIAQQILDKKADYVLALKGNQGNSSARMSNCSPSNRRPMASRMQKSAAIRPSTATTAASRPEPTPRSMTWPGSRNAMVGRDCKASSWLRARAKSPTRSSGKPASTLPRSCGSQVNSDPSSAAIGRSRTASTG